MNIIELHNVCAGYDGRCVLHNVNLNIRPHDFLGIIGPNGGGKTTLAKTILGLVKPANGNIRFFRNGTQVPNLRFGYLPQYNRIDKKFPISVSEVVRSGIKKSPWRRYTDEERSQLQNTLTRMGLQDVAKRPIGDVSSGQLQRALLGRAVISQPEVVLLDEPDTYVDKPFEIHFYRLLEQINQHSAIILISHDIGSVLRNVRSIACVNRTLHYHPDTELPEGWLDQQFGCPIDLVGHGNFPHRVLKNHTHDTPVEHHL